jgi:hypothetical protein
MEKLLLFGKWFMWLEGIVIVLLIGYIIRVYSQDGEKTNG